MDSQVFDRYYYIGIMFWRLNGTILHGCVDSYKVGDKDSRRSTIGYVFTMGGATISWILKL